MKIKWGWGIATLYVGFVILIVALVVGASMQRVDLVSNDYYGEELAFQKVIDGGKNQASLASPIAVQNDTNAVKIEFPAEFRNKTLGGNILFYCAANSDWDYDYKLKPDDYQVTVNRKALHKARYTVKITCTMDGKNYYQESEIALF